MWFPLKLYKDLTKLQLAASEVVWQRGMMMWQEALSGQGSPTPKFTQEMTDMVNEKFAVIPEVALAIWQQQLKQANNYKINAQDSDIESYWRNWTALYRATLSPLNKRAGANQKRLRKRA